MQDQLMNAQQELADAVVEGSAGGGLVKAKVNGQGDLVDLTISAALVEDGDAEDTAQTIADLVLAAVRDANRAAADLQAEKMGPLASGIGALGSPGGPGAGPGTQGTAGPGTGTAGPGSIPPIPGVGDFPSQPHGGEPRGDDL
jgi:DNA-binding protein YbaB